MDDTLPAALADLTKPQLEAARAAIVGDIAALERIGRMGARATAALVVDEGDVSLIVTLAQEDAQ